MSQQNINFTASESKESSSESTIKVTLVGVLKRPDFFNAFFGGHVREATAVITIWFKHYFPYHQGGYLEYLTTDNGGCFVVPSYEGKRRWRSRPISIVAKCQRRPRGSPPCSTR